MDSIETTLIPAAVVAAARQLRRSSPYRSSAVSIDKEVAKPADTVDCVNNNQSKGTLQVALLEIPMMR